MDSTTHRHWRHSGWHMPMLGHTALLVGSWPKHDSSIFYRTRERKIFGECALHDELEKIEPLIHSVREFVFRCIASNYVTAKNLYCFARVDDETVVFVGID